MIRFRDEKWEGLDGLGDDVLRELRPRAERAVKTAAVRFEAELKRTLTGARSGRTYRVSRTGALHVASAPGEPPAVLTGALRNSMGHTEPKWQGFTVSSEVGSGLGVKATGTDDPDAYARRLEFGGSDSRGVYIAPRPYMQPTSDRMEPVIQQIFEAAL